VTKKEHFKFWVIGFAIVSLAVLASYYVIWLYKPPEAMLPTFSWIQIGLTFLLGFFPSVISRIGANVKTGQVDLDLKGIIESFRDAVYGWLIYYILLVVAFILWDFLVWGQLPSFW